MAKKDKGKTKPEAVTTTTQTSTTTIQNKVTAAKPKPSTLEIFKESLAGRSRIALIAKFIEIATSMLTTYSVETAKHYEALAGKLNSTPNSAYKSYKHGQLAALTHQLETMKTNLLDIETNNKEFAETVNSMTSQINIELTQITLAEITSETPAQREDSNTGGSSIDNLEGTNTIAGLHLNKRRQHRK